MKKFLFSLFFIWLLLIPAFAEYTIDGISVSAEIQPDGSALVSSLYQLTFDSVEERVVLPLPKGEISNVYAGEEHFRLAQDRNGYSVIASTTGGYGGGHSFLVTYNLAADYESNAKGIDYTIHLLSSQWSKRIKNMTFQITFPGSSDTEAQPVPLEPTLIGGYQQDLEEDRYMMDVQGNVIIGSLASLASYDTLKLQVHLPSGYFYVRERKLPVVQITYLAIGMLVVLVLCFVYWAAKLRRRHSLHVTSRLLPPEGLLACQLPQVLDGKSVSFPALIYEWANLGYISIYYNRKKGVTLLRNMDMGSERSKAEQELFRRIFRGANRVTVAPGGFSGPAARYRRASRRALNRLIFDRKGGNVVFVQIPCRLLAAVGIGALAYAALPKDAVFVILAVLAGIVGFLYSIYLHRELAQRAALGTRSFLLYVVLILGLAMLVGGLLLGALPEIGIGLGACCFSAIATGAGPRRSDRGLDAMEQAMGCRKYYREVSWNRLQVSVGRSRRFFQQQLPYAVALGVDGVFAKRFDRLPCPQPEWLTGIRLRDRNVRRLQLQLQKISRILDQAFR